MPDNIARAVVLLPILLTATAAAAPPRERVVEAGTLLTGSINGQPARVRIDPAGTGMPLITPAAATRAGLKGGMLAGQFAVGPVRRKVPTAVARLTVGSTEIKRRVGWVEGAAAGADVAIGPAGLPEPVVRFVLRPERSGERVTVMRLAPGGLIGGSWGVSVAEVPFGTRGLLVRFDPASPISYVSAGAGAVIARDHGGALLPGTATAAISLGIARPVRRMRLARAFAVGPVALSELSVRTGDYGSAASIAEADAAEGDPDETVTVVGKAKAKRYRDRLTLGADALAGCSSITFDRAARQIRLSCR